MGFGAVSPFLATVLQPSKARTPLCAIPWRCHGSPKRVFAIQSLEASLDIKEEYHCWASEFR